MDPTESDKLQHLGRNNCFQHLC